MKLGNLDHIKHHVNFGVMPSSQEAQFMQRALELAKNGRGSVSPNPMVGCVIVHDGIIIGEGWHKAYNEPHAEVNAIKSVEDVSKLSESTCYVTLEPCVHFGKTPPCADLLIKEKIGKVVIGCIDPNPLVSGKGIEKLKAAGIEVEIGLLEEDCKKLNARFFTSIEKKRPYIILKWAQTKDGFIARENFDSKWISNPESRTLVHQWRAEEDAILVGTNTAKYDNPSLNVRDWDGQNPIRVVIDNDLKLDKSLHLFDQKQPTIVYNCQQDDESENLIIVKLKDENFIDSMVQDLFERKIQSIIIEGGAAVLNAFIGLELWDEARVFTSPQKFEKGIIAPRLDVSPLESIYVINDKLDTYYNE